MSAAGQPARLRERLGALQIACDEVAARKLLQYHALMEDWNARVNLTGDASFDAMLDSHLMDSLTPLTAEGLLPQNAALIDVGSGAGLPGIPLAILCPDLHVTLLDSLAKRVGFLSAAIDALELSNVCAVHARAEDAARDAAYRERFDVAMARAVASLPVLMELLLPFVRIGGRCVCFKGPSVAPELAAGQAAAEMLGGGRPEVLSVNVPYLPRQRHCLVVSEKLHNTPTSYPRKAGTPAKNPLGGQ